MHPVGIMDIPSRYSPQIFLAQSCLFFWQDQLEACALHFIPLCPFWRSDWGTQFMLGLSLIFFFYLFCWKLARGIRGTKWEYSKGSPIGGSPAALPSPPHDHVGKDW